MPAIPSLRKYIDATNGFRRPAGFNQRQVALEFPRNGAEQGRTFAFAMRNRNLYWNSLSVIIGELPIRFLWAFSKNKKQNTILEAKNRLPNPSQTFR